MCPFKLHRRHNTRYLATQSRLYQLPALSKDANEDVEQVAPATSPGNSRDYTPPSLELDLFYET